MIAAEPDHSLDYNLPVRSSQSEFQMGRLSVLALALVTMAAAGVAAPVPTAAQKPVLYYPTAVGAKWVYEWGGVDRVSRSPPSR